MANILVIDDDGTMREMLVQLLKHAGYKVKSAADGKRALKLLDAHTFDLIVTDLVMPEIEGVDLIQVIRTLNKSVPIIAISGGARNDPKSLLESARVSGANITFEKPFHAAPFLAALKKCLGARG